MRIEPLLDEVARAAIRDTLDVDAPAILRPTQDPKHGDYQVNGVLGLAKRLKKNPRELATKVAARLAEHEAIGAAEVAGPGFVNLRLSDAWLGEVLAGALADREREGSRRSTRPRRSWSTSRARTSPSRCTWGTCDRRSSARRS